MTYDAADRLTTMQQSTLRTTYTYDDNGNMTVEWASSTRTTYSYDMENRLTTTQRFADRTTSTYSGDGLRRSFHADGVLRTFVWNGDDYLQERT